MGRIFLSYLWPSAAGALVSSVYILIDTIFIGRIFGSQGLAALDLALPLYNVFMALGYLLGVGGAAAYSIRLGQDQSIIWHSILGGLGLSAVVSLGGQLLLARSCPSMVYLRDYLGVLLIFAPFFIFTALLAPIVTNDGAPRLAMWALACGAGLNIILDFLFIVGFGWGMAGAALATGLAAMCSAGILAVRFLSARTGMDLAPRPLSRQVALVIITNGFPSFLAELGAGLTILFFNRVLMSLAGEEGVAVHGILANISLVCLALFTGIGQASQPLVSHNYGLRRWRGVRQVRNLALASAVLLGTIICLSGQIFPRAIAAVFVRGDSELLTAAVRGIRLYFWAFLPMGANAALMIYYQSLEFARHAALLSVGRICLFIPLGLVLLPSWLGLEGVWLVMPFAECLSLILGWCVAKLKF